MTYPTLEQIAAGVMGPYMTEARDTLLAREIQALRAAVSTLEAARDGVRDSSWIHVRDYTAFENRLADARRERDEARARADRYWRDVQEVESNLDRVATERDEAYEKLTQDVREHYPPALRIVVSHRDALQQRLDGVREELKLMQEANSINLRAAGDLSSQLDASRAALAQLVAMIEMGERVYRCGNLFKSQIPGDSRDKWTHGTWVPRDPTDFHEFLALAASHAEDGGSK